MNYYGTWDSSKTLKHDCRLLHNILLSWNVDALFGMGFFNIISYLLIPLLPSSKPWRLLNISIWKRKQMQIRPHLNN